MFTFSNNRVNLRAVTMADLDDRHRWRNDFAVIRFLGDYRPHSRTEEAARIAAAIRQQGQDRYEFMIEANDLDAVRTIGRIGLFALDWQSRHAGVGISIEEPKFWSKGYGTAAMSLLLDYSFGELNLHRLWLDVYDFNPRAIRSYEKAGFKLEATLQQHFFREGSYHDIYVMGVLFDDWQARRTNDTPSLEGGAG